jgi:hypothetical protein
VYHKFKVSLRYIVRPYLKAKHSKTKLKSKTREGRKRTKKKQEHIDIETVNNREDIHPTVSLTALIQIS